MAKTLIKDLSDTELHYNIYKAWQSCTLQDKIDGRLWYQEANQFCEGIADGTGYSIGHIIAVLAVLSPRNKWERNKVDCFNLCYEASNQLFDTDSRDIKAIDDDLIQTYRDELTRIKVATFHTNKMVAINILTDKESSFYYNYERILGQKTRNFAYCIHHAYLPCEHVCIDTHATRIAVGELNGQSEKLTASNYDRIAKAYVTTAKIISGETGDSIAPQDLQAITWVNFKRVNNI
jgi:hypothetical protein